MQITVDFGKITGTIKPMHGVGQPPFLGANFSMFSYLTEAGIPYSRLHDIRSCVDIYKIFPDFDADPYNPDSYDFVFTDRLIKKMIESSVEPFFRLGVSIENSHALKAYYIYPPKDFKKWAVICEHIIRHYNEGWANGFNFGIKYWEIWNEPDDCYNFETSCMWLGTPQEYYELYDVASKHLKARFGDSIKVGGYASCGFYHYEKYSDLGDIGKKATCLDEFFFEFLDGFLKYIKANNCPIDFFSWHSYSQPEMVLKQADVCREILIKYGFPDVPDILNEWNTHHVKQERKLPLAAAKALALMLGMQNKTTELLCFYDARIGPSEYGGMFNPDSWEPYPLYYSFKSFNESYKLKNQTESICDNPNVYTLSATDGENSVLLISNLGEETDCLLNINGASLENATVKIIDEKHLYEIDNSVLKGNSIHLSANSCAEIKF